MGFFSTAITTFQTVITAVGAGIGVIGFINLFEGIQSDNPSNKNQGIKQAVAGAAIILAAQTLIPLITI